jgi:hypothetical protein
MPLEFNVLPETSLRNEHIEFQLGKCFGEYRGKLRTSHESQLRHARVSSACLFTTMCQTHQKCAFIVLELGEYTSSIHIYSNTSGSVL